MRRVCVAEDTLNASLKASSRSPILRKGGYGRLSHLFQVMPSIRSGTRNDTGVCPTTGDSLTELTKGLRDCQGVLRPLYPSPNLCWASILSVLSIRLLLKIFFGKWSCSANIFNNKDGDFENQSHACGVP